MKNAYTGEQERCSPVCFRGVIVLEMLEELKEKLRVTWNTEDDRLLGMLERGKSYFINLVGTPLDFEKDDDPKTLLFERCFYDYNNALGDFEENYERELLRLIFRSAVEYEKIMEAVESGDDEVSEDT